MIAPVRFRDSLGPLVVVAPLTIAVIYSSACAKEDSGLVAPVQIAPLPSSSASDAPAPSESHKKAPNVAVSSARRDDRVDDIPPAPSTRPSRPRPALSMASPSATLAGTVQSVVMGNTAGVKGRCWDSQLASTPSLTSATATMSITIDASGAVTSVTGSGTDATLVACLSQEMQTWQFPQGVGPFTVNIPFRFVTQSPPAPSGSAAVP
jgi:hypothetical protein